MQFTEHRPTAGKFIRSCAAGSITIDEDTYESSLIVFGDEVRAWPIETVTQLSHASAEAIIAHDPELVLVGTGERFALPDLGFQQALREAGIGCEPMATDAACRTFNVLIAEDRKVLAALIV